MCILSSCLYKEQAEENTKKLHEHLNEAQVLLGGIINNAEMSISEKINSTQDTITLH